MQQWIRKQMCRLLDDVAVPLFRFLFGPVVRRLAAEAASEKFPMIEHLVGSVPMRKMPAALFTSCKDVSLAMNMANNFFNFTTASRCKGWNSELVLWPDVFDCSVFADPRWELEDFEAPEDFSRHALTSAMPEGVLDVTRKNGGELRSDWNSSLPGAKVLLDAWLGYEASLPYLRAFRRHKILLASGLAIAMAPFAEMPYVTFPSGGDLYITPFENNHLGCLMRAGWRRASAHIFSGAHFYRFAADLGLNNIAYIPILIDTFRYAPLLNREIARAKELERLQCDRLFLVASRHDWDDKGTGKIIAAIEGLRKQTNIRFKVLMTSWGKEIERSKKAVSEAGLSDICVFLPAQSKSKLRYWMSVSDAVVDQFCIGEYGTLTLESMAVGRPTMLYYVHRNKVPALLAYSADEIRDRMLWVLQNPADAEALGAQAREWILANHGPEVVLPKFEAVFCAVLNNQAVPDFAPLMDA